MKRRHAYEDCECGEQLDCPHDAETCDCIAPEIDWES